MTMQQPQTSVTVFAGVAGHNIECLENFPHSYSLCIIKVALEKCMRSRIPISQICKLIGSVLFPHASPFTHQSYMTQDPGQLLAPEGESLCLLYFCSF